MQINSIYHLDICTNINDHSFREVCICADFSIQNVRHEADLEFYDAGFIEQSRLDKLILSWKV